MLKPNIYTYDYKIIKESKLIIIIYSGQLGLGDLINVKSSLINDSDYDSTYSIIEDLTKSEIKFSINDIRAYINFYRNHNKLNKKIKNAYISIKPQETSIVNLFEHYKIKNNNEYKSKINISFNCFSTIESALKWINIKPDSNTLNLIFEIFK